MRNIKSLCHFLFSFLFMVSSGAVFGSVSNPEPAEVHQPDGSPMIIRVFGDEWYQYTETLDGYSIMKNRDNWWVYAEKAPDGNLVPSDRIASPDFLRTAGEIGFLNSCGKHLRPSDENIFQFENMNTHRAMDMKKIGALRKTVDGQAGTIWRVCVLLVEFPDLPHRPENTANVFANMLNQTGWEGGIGSPGSVNDYYREVSYGEFGIQADVYGWYLSAKGYGRYGWSEADKWDRSRELALEVITKADPYVDYSHYDNDGDGTAEAVVIIHAGPGSAENGDLQYIWPHHHSFAERIARDGVNLYDYTMQEEIQYNRLTGIGMLIHEYSHTLGLPDLYDSDGSSGGVGNWCVMGSSSWLNYGRTPSHLCAWSKEQLRWIVPNMIDSDRTVPCTQVETDNTGAYKYTTDIPTEYFLIENRQRIGWDAYLPGGGLLIWHIDSNVADNSNENHKKVDLEEADGLRQLDRDGNRGDAGDPYPGTSDNRIFNYTSNPNSCKYDNFNSGLFITSISNSDPLMTAAVAVHESKKGTYRR